MEYLYKKKQVKISAGRLLLTCFLIVLSVWIYGAVLFFLPLSDRIAAYGLSLQLCSFVVAFFVLLFCIVKIHKQKLKHIFTHRKKINYQALFYAFFIWAAILLLVFVGSYFFSPEQYVWNFNAAAFYKLLLSVLLLMPFQTSFEEIFFRGYLLQYFSWRGYRPFVVIIFTSVLFGLLHFANPAVEKMGMATLLYYTLWGIFFAIITVMSGGLELALGIHAAHNMLSTILVTSDWTFLHNPSLFRFTGAPNLLTELGVSVFFQVLLLYYFSKKYKWQPLKTLLNSNNNF